MDVARNLPLVVFLSTSSKVKIRTAVDHPYNQNSQQIYFCSLFQIATCQIKSKDHKMPVSPVLCNFRKVFHQTLVNSYPANTDLNSPTLDDICLPPDTCGTYDTDTDNSDSDATSSTDARDACQIAADTPPDVLEGSGKGSIEFDSRFSSTSSVIVEHFSFSNPGAPISGMPQGFSYGQFQAMPYAPFRSQWDWDIARWAKTHSTTLLAVADLLALPDVCTTRPPYLLCV